MNAQPVPSSALQTSVCLVHWHGDGPYYREGQRIAWCQRGHVDPILRLCPYHAANQEGCRCNP